MKSAWKFINRNKSRLAWLSGISGAAYMLIKYAERKWDEIQANHEVERAAKSNIRRRFEQNLADCSFVVASLLPSLADNLFGELNVELITSRLQQHRDGKLHKDTEGQEKPRKLSIDYDASGNEIIRKSKMELWEDLKILSFTRTISSIYLMVLLSMFCTVQLSVLGRYFYLDSLHSMWNEEDEASEGVSGSQRHSGRRSVNEDTERKYLTFSWYVLNMGWEKCVNRTRQAVEKVIGSTSLRQNLTWEDLRKIMSDIRNEVEYDDDERTMFHRMDTFLLPVEGDENVVLIEGGVRVEDGGDCTEYADDGDLRCLLNDTRDFLESPDFESVFKSCTNDCFALLETHLHPLFFSRRHELIVSTGHENHDSAVKSEDNISDGKVIPLASVLPTVSRTVHQILGGIPNNFLDAVVSNATLKTLSVVAYVGWE